MGRSPAIRYPLRPSCEVQMRAPWRELKDSEIAVLANRRRNPTGNDYSNSSMNVGSQRMQTRRFAFMEWPRCLPNTMAIFVSP